MFFLESGGGALENGRQIREKKLSVLMSGANLSSILWLHVVENATRVREQAGYGGKGRWERQGAAGKQCNDPHQKCTYNTYGRRVAILGAQQASSTSSQTRLTSPGFS